MSAPSIVAQALLPAFTDGPGVRAPLDLQLEPGQLVCLLGPVRPDNHAWMRALAAVEPATGGRVRYHGDDPWTLDEAAWTRFRTRVGYVAPGAPVVSVIDALTNIMLPALYHHLGNFNQVRFRAEALLERIGWKASAGLLPAYLDDYHRRLLALGRCLILEPSFLFIDEVLSFEDVVQQKSVERLCANLARRDGIGIVVRTQNLGFTREHADIILYANHLGLHRYSQWDAFATQREGFIAQYDLR